MGARLEHDADKLRAATIVALAMYPMSYITRLTKSSMLDVLGQDYIRTARAKGVHTGKVIFKHALRNALIPVVTYLGPMSAYILTGSLVVETVFTIGGLGSKFVSGISYRDYPLIMGTTIFWRRSWRYDASERPCLQGGRSEHQI